MTEVAAELPPAPAPAPGRAASPYKFLDFYERRDAANFAGRDQEIDDLAAGVARSRCFVLYGRSGLGKTSLLHAGVIPRLEQRGFEVKYLRILVDPVHDLCAAVAAQLGRDAVADHELPALLAARPRPFVLVLDQFEEFFLRFSSDPAAQARFAGLLGKILDEGGEWVRLVISLREDYYAQLQDLQRAIPDLTAHGHRLVSLSAYGVRQAVVRPLIHAGITYEEPFVDRVIDELAAFDFDPLLLQIVCGEVYDDALRDARARGDATVELRAAHIERGGGIQGALTRYVAAVSETLAGDDRLIACAVLDALTTAENTKRAVPLSDLLPPDAGRTAPAPPARRDEPGPSFYLRAAPDELRRVLDRLSRARLVRQVHPETSPGTGAERAAAGDEWYELLHDRLVAVVKSWLDAEPAFDRFRFAKKLIASLSTGRTWHDEPGGLLSGTQLSDQVQPYAQRLRLSAHEAEYALRSAIHNLAGAVPTWAKIYDEATGAGSAAALLVELLAHARSAVRCGAARAVVDVADPRDQLPPLCATLALRDPDEEVRRAAGRSLAKVARAAELDAIQAALHDKPTAPRALQVVTDLLQFGGPQRVAVFSRWVRLSAGQHRKRRILREHRDRIQDRTGLGTSHGLLAASAFAVVAGIPAMALLEVCKSPEDVTLFWPLGWLRLTGVYAGVSILAAILLGGLIGWRGGARLARREALGQPIRVWTGAGVRGPTATVVALLLFLLAVFVVIYDRHVGRWGPGIVLAVASGLTVALWLLGPMAVRWIHRTIEPGSSTLRAAIWSTIAGSALALAATGAAAVVARVLGLAESFVFAITVFPVVGLQLCVAGLVLYGGTKSFPIGEQPSSSPAARRAARRLAVGLFVAVPIVACAVQDRGWIPLFPVQASLGEFLHSSRASERPIYFRVAAPHDAVLTFVADTASERDPFSLDLWVEGTNYIFHRSQFMHAGDSVLGAFSDRTGTHSVELHVEPIIDLDDVDGVTAMRDRWSFAWASVLRGDAGRYHRTIRGKVSASPSPAKVAVRLVWPTRDYQCRYADRRRCPTTDLDTDVLSYGGLVAEPAPDGTWSFDVDFEALYQPRPLAPPRSLQLLVGYRLLDVR